MSFWVDSNHKIYARVPLTAVVSDEWLVVGFEERFARNNRRVKRLNLLTTSH